jgi:uncharacterized membrane protein
VGQTVAILWGYSRWRRHAKKHSIKHGGLLPNHVILLGVSLLGADTEVVWQNYVRGGHDLTVYAVVNPVLLAVTNFGLYLVMRYEFRRVRVQRDAVA